MENGIISSFKEYKVINDDRDPDELLNLIHKQFFHGKGPNTNLGLKADKPLSFDISEFEFLCAEVASLDNVESVTGHDYFFGRYSDQNIPLILRHDVDGDLETALKIARIEHKYGLKGTFYLLPAGIYYSDYYWSRSGTERIYDTGLIKRYERMAPQYLEIQSLGHEVGIHFFPYGVYQEKLMDGVQGMREEVAWLRDIGLEIKGGVGHSSWATYGADSAEIFIESLDWDLSPRGPNRLTKNDKFVDNKGVRMPRHIVSYRDIPLEYCLEFAEFKKGYWAIHNDGVVRFSPPQDEPFLRHHLCSLPGMLNQVDTWLNDGQLEFINLMIHPVDFGSRIRENRAEESAARSDESAPGLVPFDASSRTLVREPGSRFVTRTTARNACTIETANFVNASGFLDYEDNTETIDQPCIVLIAGETFDCPHLQVSQQLQGWLKKVFKFEDRLKVAVRKYSTAGVDFEFYLAVLDRVSQFENEKIFLVVELGQELFDGSATENTRRILDKISRLGHAYIIIHDAALRDSGRMNSIEIQDGLSLNTKCLGMIDIQDIYHSHVSKQFQGLLDSQHMLNLSRIIKDKFMPVIYNKN